LDSMVNICESLQRRRENKPLVRLSAGNRLRNADGYRKGRQDETSWAGRKRSSKFRSFLPFSRWEQPGLSTRDGL
jgi:hypothetical protein